MAHDAADDDDDDDVDYVVGRVVGWDYWERPCRVLSMVYSQVCLLAKGSDCNLNANHSERLKRDLLQYMVHVHIKKKYKH